MDDCGVNARKDKDITPVSLAQAYLLAKALIRHEIQKSEPDYKASIELPLPEDEAEKSKDLEIWTTPVGEAHDKAYQIDIADRDGRCLALAEKVSNFNIESSSFDDQLDMINRLENFIKQYPDDVGLVQQYLANVYGKDTNVANFFTTVKRKERDIRCLALAEKVSNFNIESSSIDDKLDMINRFENFIKQYPDDVGLVQQYLANVYGKDTNVANFFTAFKKRQEPDIRCLALAEKVSNFNIESSSINNKLDMIIRLKNFIRQHPDDVSLVQQYLANVYDKDTNVSSLLDGLKSKVQISELVNSDTDRKRRNVYIKYLSKDELLTLLTTKDDIDNTLVRTALRYHCNELFEDLLNSENFSQDLLKLPDSRGKTALHLAVESRDQVIVNKIVKSRHCTEDILSAKDKVGDSPLFSAVRTEDSSILMCLLDGENFTQALLKSPDSQGRTALHLAAELLCPTSIEMVILASKHCTIELLMKKYRGRTWLDMLGPDWDAIQLKKEELRDGVSDGYRGYLGEIYKNLYDEFKKYTVDSEQRRGLAFFYKKEVPIEKIFFIYMLGTKLARLEEIEDPNEKVKFYENYIKKFCADALGTPYLSLGTFERF
ncbi:MAG: hypothetical protein ACHQ1D_11140, partial [Nitrososphaerales archaeon]